MGEIIDKTKGKIKRVVGEAVGNKKLEREGKADELEGAVKAVAADAKHAAKEAKRAIKKAVK
jgi:uncharacterized protein YjbJ (UPF0337 family)